MPEKLRALFRQRGARPRGWIRRWNSEAPWLLSMVVTSIITSGVLLAALGAGASWR